MIKIKKFKDGELVKEFTTDLPEKEKTDVPKRKAKKDTSVQKEDESTEKEDSISK